MNLGGYLPQVCHNKTGELLRPGPKEFLALHWMSFVLTCGDCGAAKGLSKSDEINKEGRAALKPERNNEI